MSLAALLAAAACADHPPGLTTRQISTVEQNTVAIRLYDRQQSQEVEAGTGLVVAHTAEQVTILSARHVIDLAAEVSSVRAEVRFQGREAWTPARILETFADTPEFDACLLTVAQEHVPFDPGKLANTLNIASPDSLEPGNPVWALGFDTVTRRIQWHNGTFTSRTPDGYITFESKTVKPGCSGGVIMSISGPVGMTLSIGTAGRENRALDLAVLAARAEAKGHTVQLELDIIGKCLNLAHRNKRVLALHGWDLTRKKSYPIWAAIAVDTRSGPLSTGRIVTGQAGGECSLERSGSGLTFEHPGLKWGNGRFPAGRLQMQPDPSVSIPGFLVFKAESPQRVCRLALPTVDAELLSARLLAGAAEGRWRECRVASQTRTALVGLSAQHVAGTLPAFSFVVRGPQKQEGLYHLVTLPAVDGNSGVRLSGRVALTDNTRELLLKPASKIQAWRQVQFEALTTDGSSRLALATLTDGAHLDMPVRAGGQRFRLGVPRPPGGIDTRGALLVLGLAVHYSPDSP